MLKSVLYKQYLLEIETSFIGTQCSIRRKIEYLKDLKISCSRTDLIANNLSLQAETYFANLSIIANPNRFNRTKYIGKNILQVFIHTSCKKPKNLKINFRFVLRIFVYLLNQEFATIILKIVLMFHKTRRTCNILVKSTLQTGKFSAIT